MKIRRQGSSWQADAPAKVNLFLEVYGKRLDGFHELRTVMCPVSLTDQIRLSPSAEEANTFRLTLPEARSLPGPQAKFPGSESSLDPSGHSDGVRHGDTTDAAWHVPQDNSNLVMRALEAVQLAVGTRQRFHVELVKAIPAAAGLGGGSSDAASIVVLALAALGAWNRRLADQICAQLGSDLNFFLGGLDGIGLGLCSGRGETCELLSCQPNLHFLITHPPVGCDTGTIFSQLSIHPNPRDPAEIVDACQTGQFQKIGAALFNALQSAAVGNTGWIATQLDWLQKQGSSYCLMSGSGSSCFALTEQFATLADLKAEAAKIGVKRVYQAQAWYAPAIESQLRRLSE